MTIALVAGTVQVAQQQSAANIQKDYEELLYQQRREGAFEAFAALRDRENQERARAAQDIQAVASQARKAGAAAKLQALEGGVGGQSFSLLMDAFERNELTGIGRVQQNLEFTAKQLRNEARSAGRIEGPRPVFGPLDSPLGALAAGLGIMAGGMAAAPAAPVT